MLEGPERLLEGEEGIFSADKTVEIDIGENLFYDWDFDDGITAQGRNFGSDIQVRGSQFPHAFADNGPFIATGDADNAAYQVSLTADDEHEQTDTAFHTVIVENVAPTILQRLDKTAEEGSVTNLGADFWGTNRIENPRAEDGTAGWTKYPESGNGFTTDAYGLPGSAKSKRVTLVDNSTPGYYVDLGTALEGSPDLFPAGPLDLFPANQHIHVSFDSHSSGEPSVDNHTVVHNAELKVDATRHYVHHEHEHCIGVICHTHGEDHPFIEIHLFLPSPPPAPHVACDVIFPEFPFIISCRHEVPEIHLLDVNPAPEPSLGAAAGLLGTWLHRDRPVGGSFSLTTPPFSWPAKHENAIVYEIDAGESGIEDVRVHLAVADGVWLWLDGTFIFGAIEQGDSLPAFFEYTPSGDVTPALGLGDLSPGLHYLQFLRSDTFTGNDFRIKVTGRTRGGRPAVDSIGANPRGNSYFFGGEDAAFGRATQIVETIEGAPEIDDGQATYLLQAFLGGHSVTADGATLTAVFYDKTGDELSAIAADPYDEIGDGLLTDIIGPVTPPDRFFNTGMRRVTASGDVPPGTRSVEVILEMTRVAGSDADGYVDNTSLQFFAPVGVIFTDPGDLDIHEVDVLWGDGSASEAALVVQEPGSGVALKDHVYLDNLPGPAFGPYTVDVTVTDDDHAHYQNGDNPLFFGTADISFGITTLNVAPIVSGVNGAYLNNDTTTRTVAIFTDPGVLDTHTATINWGDGTATDPACTSPLVLPCVVVDAPSGRVIGTHKYVLGGVLPQDRIATITVTDKDGGVTTTQVLNIIVDVPLEVHASPDREIDEGDSITVDGGMNTNVTRPLDRYEYEYNFGDGVIFGPVPVVIPAGHVLGEEITLTTPEPHVYPDDGVFLVTLTVIGYTPEDEAVSAGTDTFLVFVANASPVAEAGEDLSVEEGTQVCLIEAGFTDVGAFDTHDAIIDWGDGSPLRAGVVDEVAGTVSACHSYPDDGPYLVTLTVVDDDGGDNVDTTPVTVGNAAPEVDPGEDPTINEGERLDFSADYSDAGSADTHTATINWGDTIPVEDGTEDGEVNRLAGTVTGAHLYVESGDYTLTVCVKDDEGAETCDSVTVTVENLAPRVVAGADLITFEGEQISVTAAVVDRGPSDNHIITFNWGDGTEDSGNADPDTRSLTAFHVYADNKAYDLLVTACDAEEPDNEEQCAEDLVKVTVINVPVEILSMELSAGLEGSTAALTVPFNDPGTLDSHTGTVDWGDGSSLIDPATILESPFGPPGSQDGLDGSLISSHIYADNGSFTVEVCIDDDDEARTCQSLRTLIGNVAPTVNALALDRTFIDEGDPVPISVSGSFTDPGFDRPSTNSAESFSATIDWGDGRHPEPAASVVFDSVSGGEEVLSSGTIGLNSHVYGDDAVYTITVCVADDDDGRYLEGIIDGQGCNTATVTVNNVAPTLSQEAFESSKFTFLSGAQAFLGRKGVEQIHTASATDPGSDDLRFDWRFPGTPDRFAGTLLPSPAAESSTVFNDRTATLTGPNPFPFTDPADSDKTGGHPHGTFPFLAFDAVAVSFTAPGVYAAELTVIDDQEESDSRSLPKLVTDDLVCPKSHGYWKRQFKRDDDDDDRDPHVSNASLLAYLDVVNFASSVFSENTLASDIAQALAVLRLNDDDDDDDDRAKKRRKALADALASWLNFASGRVLYAELITIGFDEDGEVDDDGVPVSKLFVEWLAEIESTLLDLGSTSDVLERVREIAKAINHPQEGHAPCGDDGDSDGDEDDGPGASSGKGNKGGNKDD